jgi:hypothetical protein
MMLYNNTRKVFIAEKVIMADTMPLRLKGLLGRTSLSDDTCMMIVPCNSIHTFGMKFSIDVLFLDEKFKIINILENLKPRKTSPIIRNAKSVVEMQSSIVNKGKWEVGDILQLMDENKYKGQ